MSDRASPLDVDDLRSRVAKVLAQFVDQQRPVLETVSEDLDVVVDALEAILAGGKRLRPAFAFWGWRGAGGEDNEAIVRAATALELLQACALIHDDVMDGSDTRRGQPSVHRRFAAHHRSASWQGSPESYGVGAAILLGDLCLAWADECLYASGLASRDLDRAKPVFDRMRTELMAGQYLDLLEQARGGGSVERALRVARFKAAKYTVEGPLLLGATLADAPPALMQAYSDYGLPLGEAFQLRDDLLGVFGDPSTTGKPAGDDLREGKRTVLIAIAGERANARQQAVIRKYLGDPRLDEAGIDALREVIAESGAQAHVEFLIAQLADQATTSLQQIPEPARLVLNELILAATTRTG